jgi:hypothetical protein
VDGYKNCCKISLIFFEVVTTACLIRRHIDNMKLLLIYILLLPFYIWIYSCLISKICLFIVMSKYFYGIFMYLHRASWHPSATLNEFFPCFFLRCKANARVKSAKMGHGHTLQFSWCSMYWFVCHFAYSLCVNVHCSTTTRCLPNCSYEISYHNIKFRDLFVWLKEPCNCAIFFITRYAGAVHKVTSVENWLILVMGIWVLYIEMQSIWF